MKKYQIPATEVTRTMPFTVVCFSWDGENQQNNPEVEGDANGAPWRF